MAQPEFTNHGVGAPVAELRGAAAVKAADGRCLLLLVPLDLSARGYLLAVDVDRGETTQVPYPEGVPFPGAFASLLSRTGKFYTGEGGFLLEFDPQASRFTFHGRPQAAAEHFVGQSIIDGPDGRLYLGTYPDCRLVSFDPATRTFRDHGRLDAAEHYFNTIAYDSAGWFYGGIGTARMSLPACHPATGEVRQLLSEAQRTVGSATVYTAEDGKAYGSAGGQWFRLFEGKAEAIDKAQAGKAAPGGHIGYGGRTGNWGDGRSWSVNLEQGWVEVKGPGDQAARRIALTYRSGGAQITSLVAGPDGKVYASSAHPMHFVCFDPQAGKMSDLGPVKGVGGGNFCAMAVQGRFVCAPSYSSGIFHLFDTTQAFNGGHGDAPNPRELARWPEDICRPRTTAAHPDGRHVFMAGFAGYGRVGGGLGCADLETGQTTLVRHEQLIPSQSTIALQVLPDGNLVGGTSVEAPGGGHTQATEAVLYVYDWQKQVVLYQCVPVAGARDIICLEVAADGRVYGLAAGGRFFVFDPKARAIVHQDDFGAFGGPLRSGLQRQPDGLLYAACSGAVVRIDPATCKAEVIAKPPQPVSAGMAILGGRVYVACRAEVWSCALKL
jgi:streptogramin lyase